MIEFLEINTGILIPTLNPHNDQISLEPLTGINYNNIRSVELTCPINGFNSELARGKMGITFIRDCPNKWNDICFKFIPEWNIQNSLYNIPTNRLEVNQYIHLIYPSDILLGLVLIILIIVIIKNNVMNNIYFGIIVYYVK